MARLILAAGNYQFGKILQSNPCGVSSFNLHPGVGWGAALLDFRPSFILFPNFAAAGRQQ